MKTDVITVSSEGGGMDEAIEQIDELAVYKKLSAKETIHLKLLAEEMMGMLKAITGECVALFWIEDEKKNFQLHLVTTTTVNTEMRKSLMGVSSSGKNIEAKGFMGKVKEIFERALEPATDNPGDFLVKGLLYDVDPSNVGMTYTWSFNQYKESISKDDEQWDELEKSIVANLADDVQVGIMNDSVEMIIYKKIGE